MNKNFLFLGFGKMGGAIFHNFLQKNIKKENIATIDPSNSSADFKDISEIKNRKFDVVIFAIKPQNSEEILQKFAKSNLFHENTIFISILAGKNISFFEKFLGNDKKIVRVMPNLPILINEGISGYFSNKNLKNNEEKVIIDLFGQNIKVEKEDLIHQITAISGSGPAYLFLFAKNMVEAAVEIGLNQDQAQKLAIQTIFGASKMLLEEQNIEQLIDNVASKGGTTRAALDVFNDEENSLSQLTQKAVKSALKRSIELSN